MCGCAFLSEATTTGDLTFCEVALRRDMRFTALASAFPHSLFCLIHTDNFYKCQPSVLFSC
jgi:hypothetical protein